MTTRKVPVLDNASNLVRPQDLGSGTADNTKFLRGDQTWSAPPSGVSGQIVLDFGSGGLSEKSFIITNSNVISSSKLIGNIICDPTTKDQDENEMDGIDLKLVPANGSFTVYVKGLEGFLHDKFLLSYTVQ